MTRPRVIGVTGGIATGKTAVLARLSEHGAATIDGDRVYHDLIAPGGPLVPSLVAAFGASVRAADGSIDRKAMGSIVFSDPTMLARLDTITHPAIVAEIRDRIARADAEVVAIDAVKLVESGLDEDCDAVWLVQANRAVQKQRLMDRNGLDAIAADRRLDAQPTFDSARALANEVIDNSGTLSELRTQVDNAWNRFLLSATPA